MSPLLGVALGVAAFVLFVVVPLVVARGIGLRDRMESPAGARVRVEARTTRPWVKR